MLGYTHEPEDTRKHGGETTEEHSMYRLLQFY